MRFDRGVRSLALRPYPKGFTAAPPDVLNEEDPHCQFGGAKDEGVWISDESLPILIELQVRIIPVWVDNESAQAKLDDYAVCPLYPPQTIFGCLCVEATGHGQFQLESGGEKIPFVGKRILNYILDIPTPYLYQKKFLVQHEGRFIKGISHTNSLWAYGGKQGEDDFYPVVCSLGSLQGKTIVHDTTLSFWREKGIMPNQGGQDQAKEIQFEDLYTQDQLRTFKESLEAGMSEVKLEMGLGEGGKPLVTSYDSYRLSGNHLFYKRRG